MNDQQNFLPQTCGGGGSADGGGTGFGGAGTCQNNVGLLTIDIESSLKKINLMLNYKPLREEEASGLLPGSLGRTA